MKNTHVSAFLLLCAAFAGAQSPNFSWVKQVSGPANETPVSINLDASGNIYTCGYFEGTVDFDPGAATYTLLSPGVVSMYISKLDPTGNFLWAKQVSTPVQVNGAVAHPTEQVLCSNGDICIAGYYTGPFDFDPGAGNFYMASQAENAFVLKLSAHGNFLWARQWGNTVGGDMANAIAVDASDAIYTTGFFMDTVDFDPGVPSFTLATGVVGGAEAFISKLDASGNLVWAKKLNAISVGSIGYDISLDANGNIYSTGTFHGTADFDPGSGAQLSTSVGDQDIYVWKLDASGNFVWAKTMGGTTKEGGTAIVSDHLGNIFVSGFFTGTCDFDPGAATSNLISAGNDDLFTLKLDAQGSLLWVKGAGGPGTDVVSAMVVDGTGAVYSTGQFFGTVDFDPGAATHSLSASAINPFISKFDGQGNFKWAKQIEGSAYAAGSSIALNASNHVYTAGIFSVTADFDPNAGTKTLTAAGNVDGYIHKLICTDPPDVTVAGSGTLCQGNSVTLIPSGADIYSLDGMSGFKFVVSPTVTTTYTLMGIVLSCTSIPREVTLTVEACTGLEQLTSGDLKAKVYPNPGNGNFILEASINSDITIVNALGKVVYSKTTRDSKTSISLKELAAGIYFIKVDSEAEQQVLKLVKQ